MRKVKAHEGRVIRGLRFRAYPTPEQEVKIAEQEDALRRFWNALVARGRMTSDANAAYALRQGLVEPRPQRPDYDAMPEQDRHKERDAYRRACRAWRQQVAAATKKLPECRYRSLKDWADHFHTSKDHLAECLLDDFPQVPVTALRELIKAYEAALAGTKRGLAPPVFKRATDPVPIASGNGYPLSRGEFGPRPSCPNGKRKDWLDAAISFPGVGQIACRLGPEAQLEDREYWVMGVSLVREPDGWYAAIRQHVVPRPAPQPVPGLSCGIDVGLIDLVAIVRSDGEAASVPNPRTQQAHIDRIAARQAAGKPVGKLHAQAARNVRQIIRERVFPVIDSCEQICVEEIEARIGQKGCMHVSFMRTLVTMAKARYGEGRVVEVDPCMTSQICSRCGAAPMKKHDKTREVSCPACKHRENRDINAARNILARGRSQSALQMRESTATLKGK